MRSIRIELIEANDFIIAHHRHHKPVVGHRFSLGAEHDGRIVGVCIVGRPVARKTDQKYVAEVTRLCTDGTKNACSFLYGLAARMCREMGFHSIQTFILESEDGKTLEACGWSFSGMTKGGTHEREGRPRRRDQPECPKKKYVKILRT